MEKNHFHEGFLSIHGMEIPTASKMDIIRQCVDRPPSLDGLVHQQY
jgi:hypothetical protein